MITPNIIKLKIDDMDNVGKTAGNISALSTLGGIFGTFLGGFWLVPSIGSRELLYGLSIVVILLTFIVEELKLNKKTIIQYIITLFFIGIIISIMLFSIRLNNIRSEAVLNGELNVKVEEDTEYGKVVIYNFLKDNEMCRLFEIDNGNESATYIGENKNELVFEYTKFYDLMFNSSNEINDVLMIGGAGNSYTKYYISHYLDKRMDVVEIDKKVTELSKKYFFVDDLFIDYGRDRINLIEDDGRTYLNKNTKKYDAILNDAFAGGTPATVLTTIEAIRKIYTSLNKDGLYLTNIISSLEGENADFLKAEVNTLKHVFRNVYVFPCNYDYNDESNYNRIQNLMVIATDDDLDLEGCFEIQLDNQEIILTDNYCPIDNLIPKEYR